MVAIPPTGDAIGNKLSPLGRSRNQIGACFGLLFIGMLILIFSHSSQTATTANSPLGNAADLFGTFNAQLKAGNTGAALGTAIALKQRFPDSTEARTIQPQLSALQEQGAERQRKFNEAAMAQRKAAEATRQKDLAEVTASVPPENASATHVVAEGSLGEAAVPANKEDVEIKGVFLKQFSNLRRVRDEVTGTTFYYSREVPMTSVSNYFGLYLGVRDGQPFLRWKFMYAGDNWLFIKSLDLNIDGKELGPFDFPYGAIERDNSAGRVWEWHDEPIQSGEQMLPFIAIGASKKVILRLEGQQYRKDRVLSEKEKMGMLKILDVYAGLKKWGVPK